MPTPIPAPAPPDQAAPPAGDEQQPFDVNEWQHIKTGNGMQCSLVNVRTGFRTDIHKHMKDALDAARRGETYQESQNGHGKP